MAVSLIPVGPDVAPAMQGILQSFYDALTALQAPAAPMPLFEIATEAELLDRAPAEAFPNCFVLVTELNLVAISTDVAGTWTWLRADGSAL